MKKILLLAMLACGLTAFAHTSNEDRDSNDEYNPISPFKKDKGPDFKYLAFGIYF